MFTSASDLRDHLILLDHALLLDVYVTLLSKGFRLHRMHEMQTIVNDDRSVCQSVWRSRGLFRLHCAKMAKQIKMPFGLNTSGAHGTLC